MWRCRWISSTLISAQPNASGVKTGWCRPIVPMFANTGVDIPSLPQVVFPVTRTDANTVCLLMWVATTVPLPGNVFRQHRKCVKCSMWSANTDRLSQARRAASLCALRKCRLKCTAIVNNSSIGNDTTEKDIANSLSYAHACARLCNVPLLSPPVRSPESRPGDRRNAVSHEKCYKQMF